MREKQRDRQTERKRKEYAVRKLRSQSRLPKFWELKEDKKIDQKKLENRENTKPLIFLQSTNIAKDKNGLFEWAEKGHSMSSFKGLVIFESTRSTVTLVMTWKRLLKIAEVEA